MIWRRSYTTRICQGLSLPLSQVICLDGSPADLAACDLLVAGWGLAALGEMGVWERLYRGEGAAEGLLLGLAAENGRPALAAQAMDAVKASSHPRFAVWDDREGALRRLLEPDGPQRAFAWAPRAQLVMVGPPTEEAWDTMKEAVFGPDP